MASDFDPVVVELPHWPSCPACGGLVSPSRFADMERQDGNLAELERVAIESRPRNSCGNPAQVWV